MRKYLSIQNVFKTVYLERYGVLGMKWGIRKSRIVFGDFKRKNRKMAPLEDQKRINPEWIKKIPDILEIVDKERGIILIV